VIGEPGYMIKLLDIYKALWRAIEWAYENQSEEGEGINRMVVSEMAEAFNWFVRMIETRHGNLSGLVLPADQALIQDFFMALSDGFVDDSDVKTIENIFEIPFLEDKLRFKMSGSLDSMYEMVLGQPYTYVAFKQDIGCKPVEGKMGCFEYIHSERGGRDGVIRSVMYSRPGAFGGDTLCYAVVVDGIVRALFEGPKDYPPVSELYTQEVSQWVVDHIVSEDIFYHDDPEEKGGTQIPNKTIAQGWHDLMQ